MLAFLRGEGVKKVRQYFLGEGVKTAENFTALHVAAHSGHTDLIELLLAKYKVCEQAPPFDFNAMIIAKVS